MGRILSVICTVAADKLSHRRFRYLGLITFIVWSSSHQIFAEKPGNLESTHDIHIPTEYEITIPFISDNEGNFISFELNRMANDEVRVKRSITEEPLYIRVTLSKEDMLLRLNPNNYLIAPMTPVEWHTEDNITVSELNTVDCFYTGSLVHRNCSHIAVSSCQGLIGLIKTDDHEYFIEPLESRNRSTGQHHVIYKRASKIGGEIVCPDSESHAEESHLRVDRSVSAKKRKYKHVEVLLAADHSVVYFHGRTHVQIYLLSLMNIVNMIYKHESLEVKLNIAIVRMILMDSNRVEVIEGNARETLENVCRWANSVQKEIDDPHHHDYVVFLSRENFGPAGYAPVTGMCYYPRSCSVTKDEGLTSAFIVAHETGHVLGMHHDGDLNFCAPYTADGNIMAPLVQATYHRYYWSRCSNEYLNARIHYFSCLDDTPFKHRWPKVRRPLGIRYTMDHQCRNEFGAGYRLCRAFPVYDPCHNLWCAKDDNPHICKTKRGPPLEGTQCAPGKWCKEGHCLHIDSDFVHYLGGYVDPDFEEDDDYDDMPVEALVQHTEDYGDLQEQNQQKPVEMVHGSWSSWGSFGSCSRTCGTGVQFRRRTCNNPEPSRGGNPCEGTAEIYQLCNTQTCSKRIDFRAEQCRKLHEFTNKNVDTGLSWIPYQPSNSSRLCKLNCIARETNEIIVTSVNVIDGTRCSYDRPHDICIHGQCHRAGCDHVLGSRAKEDECGICEGNGAQCQEVEKLYLRAPKPGVRLVTVIPKGARHINIRDESRSANTLMLRRYKSEKFIINGDEKINKTLEVIDVGTRFLYRNIGNFEEISARGPTLSVILVMLRVVTRNIPVMITTRYVTLFNGEIDNRITDGETKYAWEKNGWSSCSKSCGSGEQSMKYLCKNHDSENAVDKKFCNNLKRPKEQKRTCNSFACHFKWISRDWEACSHTCGSKGFQGRKVFCVQMEKDNTEETNETVKDSLCKDEKPIDKQSCNRIYCIGYWRAGHWSECSKTCGLGIKTRIIKCVNPDEEIMNKCEGDPPSNKETCNLRLCPDDNCRYDRSVFCKMNILHRYCNLPSYNTLCCDTCRNLNHG